MLSRTLVLGASMLAVFLLITAKWVGYSWYIISCFVLWDQLALRSGVPVRVYSGWPLVSVLVR